MSKICVFINGPDHDKDYVKVDDEKKRMKLKKLGYRVLSVHHENHSSPIYLILQSNDFDEALYPGCYLVAESEGCLTTRGHQRAKVNF
jgi:histidinol phosphatase-like PHP family hydrolase